MNTHRGHQRGEPFRSFVSTEVQVDFVLELVARHVDGARLADRCCGDRCVVVATDMKIALSSFAHLLRFVFVGC